MRPVLPPRIALLLIGVLLAAAPLASAQTLTYHVHGTSALADNRAPAAVALTMDLTPGSQSQPRVVISHSGGDTVAANPVTASFVTTEALVLGDSDPATPDSVTAHVCISQTTQTAFVTRAMISVLVDDTRVARRLSNDFSIPANVPSCKSIAVTLGMFVDSQTAANTGPLEGVLDANGNLAIPAGAQVKFLVDSDTAIGGPIWGYYYDSASYPASLTISLAPQVATVAEGPIFTNLTGTQLSQMLAEPTNGTYVYNLTVSDAPANFEYRLNGTGSATVQVRDGTGTIVFNQTLMAPTNGSAPLSGVVVGNWTYTVTYQDFNGTIFLDLVQPGASPTTGTGSSSASSSSSSGTTSASTTTGNGTTSSESADTPLAAPAFTALALFALAVILRRRV